MDNSVSVSKIEIIFVFTNYLYLHIRIHKNLDTDLNPDEEYSIRLHPYTTLRNFIQNASM